MEPVLPSDLSELPNTAVSIYVEVGGVVVFESVAGSTRSVLVADNSILPVGVRKVMSTGTTATGIHAFVLT
ncbi:hypothetical protein MWU76_20755 [Gelidibacter sp. F2691]|nr:hypothetical protein [Gelidibacter sp. F2691]